MEKTTNRSNLEEIREWDDRAEVADRKYAVDDQPEIAFMVDEIEAFVPGC